MKRFVPLLGLGLLVLVVAGCGSATASPSAPAVSLSPDSPKIVAKDLKFTTTEITAPADKAFAIDFDNQDSVPHNVSIEKGGSNVFRGEVFSGPAHRLYSVAALAAGAYEFKCDVHTDMKGTLTVR
jgi:plastocyanin